MQNKPLKPQKYTFLARKVFEIQDIFLLLKIENTSKIYA